MALVWIYMFLMAKEFFIKKWLTERILIYALSHVVIMIFISKITRLDPLHNAFGRRVLYFIPSLPVSSVTADLPTTLKSPTSNGNRTNHATTNFKNNEVNIISPLSLCRYFCKHPFTKHYYYITLLLICQEKDSSGRLHSMSIDLRVLHLRG